MIKQIDKVIRIGILYRVKSGIAAKYMNVQLHFVQYKLHANQGRSQDFVFGGAKRKFGGGGKS